MKKIIVVLLLTIFVSSPALAESDTVQIKKSDYLMLLIGNYVHQFNMFDTSVHVYEQDKLVKINIYYDKSTQKEKRANNFKNRISMQIEHIISNNEWAKDYEYEVWVNSEDMNKLYR